MPSTVEPVLDASVIEDEDVRFGRNRVLRMLGAAVFGYAAQSILRREPAWAAHQPPPGPCHTYGRCHACSGSTCTLPECVYIHWEGCPTGGQCWQACHSNCVWNCCDYHNTNTGVHCLCGTCIQNSSC